MLKFLSNPIPYSYHLKKQLFSASILGALVVFIMVFLEPFGIYQFESKYKYLILTGFGVLFLIIYLINARMETLWYNAKNKRWTIKNEMISFLFFVFTISFPVHFYNQIFLNDLFESTFNTYEYFKHGIWFFWHSIIPTMLLILPFYLFFRNKFGELITHETLHTIELSGLNKGEKISLQTQELLFVKSSENYVNIFYWKNDILQDVIFRNTLTEIKRQANFLQQCHRSYLVNISTIKSVKGNSQNAKIEFHQNDISIPLSKSYYKTIKSAI